MPSNKKFHTGSISGLTADGKRNLNISQSSWPNAMISFYFFFKIIDLSVNFSFRTDYLEMRCQLIARMLHTIQYIFYSSKFRFLQCSRTLMYCFTSAAVNLRICVCGYSLYSSMTKRGAERLHRLPWFFFKNNSDCWFQNRCGLSSPWNKAVDLFAIHCVFVTEAFREPFFFRQLHKDGKVQPKKRR